MSSFGFGQFTLRCDIVGALIYTAEKDASSLCCLPDAMVFHIQLVVVHGGRPVVVFFRLAPCWIVNFVGASELLELAQQFLELVGGFRIVGVFVRVLALRETMIGFFELFVENGCSLAQREWLLLLLSWLVVVGSSSVLLLLLLLLVGGLLGVVTLVGVVVVGVGASVAGRSSLEGAFECSVRPIWAR